MTSGLAFLHRRALDATWCLVIAAGKRGNENFKMYQSNGPLSRSHPLFPATAEDRPLEPAAPPSAWSSSKSLSSSSEDSPPLTSLLGFHSSSLAEKPSDTESSSSSDIFLFIWGVLHLCIDACYLVIDFYCAVIQGTRYTRIS